ncbi:hypothetical protein AB0E83_08325 [Streptomyces sp. NPDC035033]|uniref:hypothetical protein n=1 Tax=Streptomyces sp. NPDC035033 TaxID=3155368 RepID=UPI0034014AEE
MKRTRKSRHGRWAGAVASALLSVGLLAQPAHAEVPNGAIVAGTVKKVDAKPYWVLASTETDAFASAHRTTLTQHADAAQARGIPKKTVTDVLGDLNMTARSPLGAPCHETNAAGAKGFCWDDTYGDDSKNHWVPQGIAGSGESAANQQIVGDRQVVVAGWHSDRDGSEPVYATDQLMRVTFADVTDRTRISYRHVLLVTPTSTGYEALPGHADSVTWYKNFLYVSTASGFAVFDLNRVWLMDESLGGVGVTNGRNAAAWHKYALPEVNRYQHQWGIEGSPGYDADTAPEQYDPENCDTGNASNPPPCFAGVSLDDSGAQPALVTTEVGHLLKDQPQSFSTVRTIVRWPLDRASGLLATQGGIARPEAAFESTVSGANGIAMNRGRIVISAACPEFIGGKTVIPGCLYHAWPGEPVRLWTRTGIYGQNVMYWPSTNEMWTINEKSGNRTVFHIPWPKPPVPVRSLAGAWGDLDDDGAPDLLAVRPQAAASPGSGPGNGNLVLYPGRPSSIGTRGSIGTNWDGMRLLTGVGNMRGDSKPDFLAVDSTGNLYFYPGGSGGLLNRVHLSAGWDVVTSMSGVGDLTGDGLPDLMAVWNNGTAHLYPGTATGGLGQAILIGTGGWNTMPLSTGIGDLRDDPSNRPDVLAVDEQGVLWLYPGVDKGLGPRVELSKGWGIVRSMTGVGDLTGDGLPDLMAVWNDGTAHLYPGTADGRLAPRKAVDLGWGAFA